MSNQIIIDDGFKTYELINKDKKVLGVIAFNPSDVNIVHRYKKVAEELEKIDVNVKAEGDTEETIEVIRQADEIAYEKINYLSYDHSIMFRSFVFPNNRICRRSVRFC